MKTNEPNSSLTLLQKIALNPNKKIKEHEKFVHELTLTAKTRHGIRKELISKFVDEKKGSWTDSGIQVVTNYRYNVEKLNDGRIIYLERPTYLNKGIDFTVTVEKYINDKDGLPSHKDIFHDLEITIANNPEMKDTLLNKIIRVWELDAPQDVLSDGKLNKKPYMPGDLLLKSLKWLFIEQDITYWNYDGRMRLMSAIYEKLQ